MSVSELTTVRNKFVSWPFGFSLCIYGCNDERCENGEEERVDITWTLCMQMT